MKTMTKMAIAAAMTMTMGANVMAVSINSTNSTAIVEECISNEGKSSAVDNGALSARTMLYNKGTKSNKFVYIIDGNGTVMSKTMYTYNRKDNNWTPICIYRAVYGEKDNKLYFAEWNEADQAYTSSMMSATYSKDECPILISLPDVIDY